MVILVLSVSQLGNHNTHISKIAMDSFLFLGDALQVHHNFVQFLKGYGKSVVANSEETAFTSSVVWTGLLEIFAYQRKYFIHSVPAY